MSSVAELHRLAVARALVEARREAAAAPRRARARLARERLRAGAELAEALRTLRDDARAYLEAADAPARARFAEELTAAGTELAERFGARLDVLIGPGPAPVPTPFPPPGRAARVRVEDVLTLVVGASGVLGLSRLGSVLGSVLAGLVVGALCCLALARRAAADRARLGHWATEAAADLRAGLETALADRTLLAEDRLVPVVERLAARRVAELDRPRVTTG